MTPKPLRVLFDALHHGKYSFDDFMSLDMESNYESVGWADRTIYKPSRTLKALQSFLNDVLFDYLPTNDRVSFAYRKGAMLYKAVEPHAGSRAFYQTDFQKFFDSINSDLIRRTIIDGSPPIDDIDQYLDRILQLTTINNCLPIGFVTSPAISNTCLKTFDDCIESVCRDRGLIYTRYADDIIVSASQKEDLKDIGPLIAGIAQAKIGQSIKLNAAKSKLTTIGRRIRILGFEVLPSGRVTIAKDVRQKIEYMIHFFISNRARFESIHEGDLEKGVRQLSGYISHVHSVDPGYLAKLRKKFGATIIDGLLHRSLGHESN